MRQRIWAPLGIDSGAFFPVTSPDLRARMVDVNPSDPEGLGSIVFGAMGAGALNKRAGGHCGGHGGFMSAEDYVKVLRSLLANDGTLLKPATAQDMSSPALSPEAAADHRAKVASPLGTFLAVGVPQDSKFGYATAGFLVMEDHEGWYGKGTVSWGGGLTISWFVDRKNNLCGITAPQSAGPADPMKMEDLKNAFRRGIYRAREAATK
jgi:CubicO group peptidase (beta-lactamase class C family)